MVTNGPTSEGCVKCTLSCESHFSLTSVYLDVSKERWKLTVPTAACGKRYVEELFCFFMYGRRGVRLVKVVNQLRLPSLLSL